MKIAIIGNSGSGKSTLGLTLHTLLGIPLYHLDQYFWKEGWQEPDRAEFQKIHNGLCDRQSWIIEGMAIRFLEYRIQQADMVIFLDMPMYMCLYRVCKRALMHFGTVYFSSAVGCPERGPDWKFIKYILRYNKDKRPIVLALLEQYKDTKKIFVIKNEHELYELIKKWSL